MAIIENKPLRMVIILIGKSVKEKERKKSILTAIESAINK